MSANRRLFLASKYEDKSVFITGWSQMFGQFIFFFLKSCVQCFLLRRIDSVFLNLMCYPERNEANKTAVWAQCDRVERRDKLPSFQLKSWDAAHNINLKTNRKKERKFFFFYSFCFTHHTTFFGIWCWKSILIWFCWKTMWPIFHRR